MPENPIVIKKSATCGLHVPEEHCALAIDRDSQQSKGILMFEDIKEHYTWCQGVTESNVNSIYNGIGAGSGQQLNYPIKCPKQPCRISIKYHL